MNLSWVTPKHLIVGLITLILVIGQWRYGILHGYHVLGICLASTVVTELALSRYMLGRTVPLLSAYVSGTSLTLLLKPQPGMVWPFVVGAMLAIGSKYVLRYRGRHLWNPTNFSIAALLVVAPGSVAILSHEFGNDLGTNLVIWGVGIVVTLRARIFHVTATYVLSFLAFAWLRAQMNDLSFTTEVLPLTGPMYQLFIFFMITDPPTTVDTKRGRILVAFLIALFESVLRTLNDEGLEFAALTGPAPAIFALAIVGPIALAAQQRWRARAAG